MRPDAFSALQRILTEAIQSLEPSASTPSESRAWRIYDLLSHRYVQQLTVEMVAEQLGVTARHLRREQRAALEVLAYRLQRQFAIDEHSTAKPSPPPAANSALTELAWLREAPTGPMDLQQALAEVANLVKLVAARHGVHLEIGPTEGLPPLAVHSIVLNQVLLNLLGVAIPRAASRRVSLTIRSRGREVELHVSCPQGCPTPQPVRDDMAKLRMARQLAELGGMRLQLADSGRAFTATLSVPTAAQVTVLAIDDNADALQLFERYTAGTCYRLVSTWDPEQALTLAAKLAPRIILLDVMMPGIDGWRVLAQLKQHPQTGHIPVLVCTILPQEDLALSLGASGFSRKPITQEALLAALDRQVELSAPAPH